MLISGLDVMYKTILGKDIQNVQVISLVEISQNVTSPFTTTCDL
jgi:hypothetical protein